MLSTILQSYGLTVLQKPDIINLLQAEGEDFRQLLETALQVKHRFAGKKYVSTQKSCIFVRNLPYI